MYGYGADNMAYAKLIEVGRTFFHVPLPPIQPVHIVGSDSRFTINNNSPHYLRVSFSAQNSVGISRAPSMWASQFPPENRRACTYHQALMRYRERPFGHLDFTERCNANGAHDT